MKALPVATLKSRIIKQGIKTVLFIDTCIFLDIIRSPIRDYINNTEVESAISFLKLMEQPNSDFFIVINETIKDEWSDNIKNTVSDLKREISKITMTYKNIIDVYKFIMPSSNLELSNLRVADLNIHLKILSSTFLERANVIQRADKHAVNAMKRVRENILPAQKGKAEAKDCEIFESFIDLAKNLQLNGYNGKILFVTSNHHDFGKPNVSTSLSKELGTHNAELINSLSWGLSVATNNE